MIKDKFQLWDKDDLVMREVLGIDFEYNYAMCRDGKNGFHYDLDTYKIRKSIGIKDKNNVTIYEGDIVSEPYFSNVNPDDHDDEDYLDDAPRSYVICYDSRQVKYKMVPIATYVINAGNGGWTGYEVKYERITVIGNIYANADLLK